MDGCMETYWKYLPGLDCKHAHVIWNIYAHVHPYGARLYLQPNTAEFQALIIRRFKAEFHSVFQPDEHGKPQPKIMKQCFWHRDPNIAEVHCLAPFDARVAQQSTAYGSIL